MVREARNAWHIGRDPDVDRTGIICDWRPPFDIDQATGILKQGDVKRLRLEVEHKFQMYALVVTRQLGGSEFLRYTESEMGANGEGILPHPARKVYWSPDIYFYTSSSFRESSLSYHCSFSLASSSLPPR